MTKRSNWLGILSMAISIAISITSGVLGAFWYQQNQSTATTVMVVDTARLLLPITQDDNLNEYQKHKLARDLGVSLNSLIDEYAENGIIVLDASAVVKAPEASYVQP